MTLSDTDVVCEKLLKVANIFLFFVALKNDCMNVMFSYFLVFVINLIQVFIICGNHKLVKSHLKGQNYHKGPSIVEPNTLSKNDVELTNLFGIHLLHIYNKR